MTRSVAVAAFATVSLLLTGCVSPPWNGRDTGRQTPQAGTAQWHSCQDLTTQQTSNLSGFNVSCATIKVPQDWQTVVSGGTAADGKTFDVALVRVRSTRQRTEDRAGSLLINPGGPGASGVKYAISLAGSLSSDVTGRFDIVGFDPRGVGRSSPLQCLSDSDLDAYFGSEPDPQDQAAFDANVALQQHMAQACTDKYGDSLRLFSTEQTARDMDAVREAVGDTKLTYLGYSYGTLLGAVYAELFPAQVRALVLDGAQDPTLDSIQSSESQAKGFERTFDDFAQWCHAHASQCPLGSDPRSVVMSLMDDARHSPLVDSHGRQVTAGWILYGVASGMYSQSSWPMLALALDGLRRGNPKEILTLADEYAERDKNGHYNGLFDANMVVTCTDDDQPPTVEALRALRDPMRAKYPMFYSVAGLSFMCTRWSARHDPYPKGRAEGAPPILVVGTKGDPATPYEESPALAKMLGVGTVLTWEGDGHTAYPWTRCITNAVDKYLIDLKVPAADTSCPAS